MEELQNITGEFSSFLKFYNQKVVYSNNENLLSIIISFAGLFNFIATILYLGIALFSLSFQILTESKSEREDSIKNQELTSFIPTIPYKNPNSNYNFSINNVSTSCPKCGTFNSSGSKKCTSCGSLLI